MKEKRSLSWRTHELLEADHFHTCSSRSPELTIWYCQQSPSPSRQAMVGQLQDVPDTPAQEQPAQKSLWLDLHITWLSFLFFVYFTRREKHLRKTDRRFRRNYKHGTEWHANHRGYSENWVGNDQTSSQGHSLIFFSLLHSIIGWAFTMCYHSAKSHGTCCRGTHIQGRHSGRGVDSTLNDYRIDSQDDLVSN